MFETVCVVCFICLVQCICVRVQRTICQIALFLVCPENLNFFDKIEP